MSVACSRAIVGLLDGAFQVRRLQLRQNFAGLYPLVDADVHVIDNPAAVETQIEFVVDRDVAAGDHRDAQIAACDLPCAQDARCFAAPLPALRATRDSAAIPPPIRARMMIHVKTFFIGRILR